MRGTDLPVVHATHVYPFGYVTTGVVKELSRLSASYLAFAVFPRLRLCDSRSAATRGEECLRRTREQLVQHLK